MKIVLCQSKVTRGCLLWKETLQNIGINCWSQASVSGNELGRHTLNQLNRQTETDLAILHAMNGYMYKTSIWIENKKASFINHDNLYMNLLLKINYFCTYTHPVKKSRKIYIFSVQKCFWRKINFFLYFSLIHLTT